MGRLPALLGDFAYLDNVHVNARGEGEGAGVLDWNREEGASTLLEFFRRAPTRTVHAQLNLTCLDRDLEPMEIPGGGDFWIKILLTDSGALDVASDAPVYLRLELNADIYAPWSLGDVQNNSLLAALNGPRLAGFLERIEREVPAELLEIHQDHHPPGTVGPRGFIAPAGVFKDA